MCITFYHLFLNDIATIQTYWRSQICVVTFFYFSALFSFLFSVKVGGAKNHYALHLTQKSEIISDWSFEMLAWWVMPFKIHRRYGCRRVRSSWPLCKASKGLSSKKLPVCIFRICVQVHTFCVSATIDMQLGNFRHSAGEVPLLTRYSYGTSNFRRWKYNCKLEPLL